MESVFPKKLKIVAARVGPKRCGLYREINVNRRVWWRWREKTHHGGKKQRGQHKVGGAAAAAHNVQLLHQTIELDQQSSKNSKTTTDWKSKVFVYLAFPPCCFLWIAPGAWARRHCFTCRWLIAKAAMWTLGGGEGEAKEAPEKGKEEGPRT